MRATLVGCCVMVGGLVQAGGLNAQHLHPSARLLGFADFSYLVTDQPRTSGFVQGQLVGHLASELGDRLGLFAEVSATGTSAGYRVEVERLILRYDYRDALKVSAGRFHTPISYWNTAYHHGNWLQTSVSRPEMIQGGGTFLPIHYVGLLLEGTTLPSAGLGYVAGIGNGRAANLARAGDAGEENNKLAYNVGLHARPAALPGVQIGGALLIDRPVAEDASHFAERIATGHIALERHAVELIAEHAWVHNRSDGATEWQQGRGWYVQLGVRLPDPADRVKPYTRVGAVHMPAESPIAPDGIDRRSWIGGIRYDFAEQAALKLEYQRERLGANRFNSLFVGLSYTFPRTASEPIADATPASDHH